MNIMAMAAPPDTSRPGASEIVAGLAVMALVAFGLGALLVALPLAPATLGLILCGWSGVAGLAGFGAAWLISRPLLPALGVRSTSLRWLMLGLVAGLVAFLAKGLSVILMLTITGPVPNPQGAYALGASGSASSLIAATLLLGVFTPLGEELLFRGVVTNGLLRFGTVTGVIGGALLFALFHGINIIFPAALIEGLVAGEMFRRSRSVWPAVVVHVIYNLPTIPIMALAQSA